MIQEKNLKRLGRTLMDGDALWLCSSLSEIGFSVTGATYARLRLRADDTVWKKEMEHRKPRFVIRLDGEKILDARMENPEETVTVFDSPEKRDAEVRLIKLSECTQSLMALEEIDTDGRIAPLPDKPVRIAFAGDSITCGYGVEGNERETFTTATENAEKSYAGLTSQALGADARLDSYSGYGIVSGYTGDPAVRNGDSLVPPIYEKTGCNDFSLPSGRHLQEIDWDFSAWEPDWLVVNLGTNDLSWCQGIPERCEEFRREYAAFLKTLRLRNPTARMLCVLGVMGTGLNRFMEKAAEDYRRETGDRWIRVLTLEEQNAARDGYGSDFHPSERTQRLLAESVTEVIRAWMREEG